MSEHSSKRKLAAILSADVEGYSRLMQDDEEATVRTITAYRKVITTLVGKHNGRVVDAKGDNVLAEFPSVLNAVRCAVEIQKELEKRNSELPDHRKMKFRIGVNLGDVIDDGGTIYGDGVNIAARLEGLAEGGGICISANVFDQVKRKSGFGFKCLGEHSVKNIAEPVRAYQVLTQPKYAGKVIGDQRRRPKRWERKALAALVGLILLGSGVTIWNYIFRPPDVEPASVDKMAYPLPNRPSIAVLPFEDLTGETEHAFFSDGLTEDVITSLSKVPGLFVIAPNSILAYKGKQVEIKQVAEDLGVRYVLEGSVRKAGTRMRITAQLVDATTGYHIWAERYDRQPTDIFALQDEITEEILISMQVQLTEGEQAKSWRKGIKIKAYEKLMEALGYFRRFTPADNTRARGLYEEARELDPSSSVPYTMLAWTHIMPVWNGYSKSPQEDIQLATEYAQKSFELDESSPYFYSVMAWIYLVKRDFDKAVELGERSVAFNPNGADDIALLGGILTYDGRPEEAIPLYEKAIRLNPLPPKSYLSPLGLSYFVAGRYEDAIRAHKRALELYPDQANNLTGLACSYISLGRTQEAETAVKERLKLSPKSSIRGASRFLSRRFRNQSDVELIVSTMRRAGFPE